ncbi:hypothetical protein [Streptomyces sp. NPDC047070]|uniref:hypothetical protein n=1 Tax=Streptomyces sp. NPDC047070 TaxID=3154923 RepID=UPI003456DE3E
MVLENWYFCAALGMPVEDAATHLDIIAALREPPDVPRASELVCDGLDSLLTVDTAAAVHALPYVLAAHRRFPEHRDVAARASAVYREIVSVSHKRARSHLSSLLREAGGGSWDNAVGLLETALAEASTGTQGADASHIPYLDLREHLTPTVVLIAGRFLARHRPHAVLDRLGEPPRLLTQALRGGHGRLALIQAAEFQAGVWPDTAEAVRRSLARASGGAFDMEPDLLASAARMSFAPPLEESAPDTMTALLDLLQNEALSGTILLGWVEDYRKAWDWGRPEAVARRQAAYVRLGGVAAQRDSAMPSVLWQSILMERAAELAPAEALRRIEHWWQPPAAFPDKPPTRQVHLTIGYEPDQYGPALRHIGRILALRLPPGAPVPVPMLTPGPTTATEPEAAARLWSPWMLDRPLHSGPLTGDEPEQLVRLLAASLLAERLLTNGHGTARQPHFLLLLTVHVRDMLGRVFKELTKSVAEHQGRSLIPAGHLASLITHTTRAVDRLGRGLRPTVSPDDIVETLRTVHARPLPRQGHTLRNFIRYNNGLDVALTWVRASSAGGVGPHRTEAGGRWFAGAVSAADALFDLVAEHETRLAGRVAIEAALLRREVHGDTGAAHFRWDWAPERGAPVPPPIVKAGAPQFPDHKVLLLSSPTDPDRREFSVLEWELMGDALENEALKRVSEGMRTAQHVPLTVRTLRLAALLRQPGPGDEGTHAEWVASWTELLATFNSPVSLPRVIRSRLIDMFRSEAAGVRSQERLNAVLQRVIDTIIELSPRATLYYDRLFGELGAELALPAESANGLRHRALRSFYHRWGHTAFPQAVTHPFDAYGSRISARGTEATLVALLRDTADLEFQARSVRLGAVIEEAWHRAQQPRQAPAHRRDIDAVDVDPRRVLGATMDRRTAEAVLYLRDERLDTTVVDHRNLQVHDLFLTGTDRELPGKSYVLGVVVGSERTDRGTSVQLNCGLPQLVTRELRRPDNRWTLGRAAAVQIKPGQQTASYIAPLAAPPPEPGEVRAARLSSTDTYPWLSLNVDGVDGYRYPTGATARDAAARGRWDPDLSRAFAGAPSWERGLLVMWHAEERHWLPIDAGIPELAVAEGEPSDPGTGDQGPLRLVLCGPATDRSGYGPAWRFSLTPGRTYVLGESAWDADDWTTLNDACAAEPFGLIVYARFRPGENRLHLAPQVPDRPAIDRRNVQWITAFDQYRAAPTADVDDVDEAAETYEEKAIRTTGVDGIVHWRIKAPHIEGFPQWVTALPGQQRPHRGTTLMCTVKNWGESEARKAEAEVLPAEESGIQLPRTAKNFDMLLRFRPYDLIKVTLLHQAKDRDPAKSSNAVRTSYGIRGFADTDSLTLTGEFANGGTARQTIVVTDTARPPLQPRRVPAPLLHERFAEDVGPAASVLLRPGADLPGMVARQVRGPDGTLVQVVLWLRTPDDVVEVRVPVAAFNHAYPGAGDHVVGRRSRDGWSFGVLRRTLRLRALWTRDTAPGEGWTPIGEVAVEDGVQYLYQHPTLPRVATRATLDTADPDVRTSGRARAHKADPRTHTRRTVVHLNNRALVGNLSLPTGVVLTDRPQAVHLETTELVMDDIDYEDDQPPGVPGHPSQLVDVERHFTLSPVTRAEPRRTPPRDTAAEARAEWKRILAAGTVTGQRTPDGHFLLSSGAAPDDSGAYLPWLVAADEQATMVAGRINPYPTDRVRCAFVPSGRGYRASHLRVPPVTTAEFMAEVLPQARPDGRRFKIRATRQTSRRPYYVGVDETPQGPVHRFEFGYGWFFDVPEAGLTVGGDTVDPTGLTLFHGDRVDAVSFGRDTTGRIPGGITLDIALADITKGIESHVRREASDRVVHLLDVDLDHVRDQVAVHRVHTGNRRLEPGREDFHDREERLSAYLDPEDAKKLLAAHASSSGRRRKMRILGRMATESEGKPRLKPRFTLVLPYATADERQGLREGDSLYLSAGLIHPSVNDLFLGFELPGTTGLPDAAREQDDEDRALTVVVGRRDFSHRENCLRRAAEAGDDVYQDNAKMLVRLEQLYDGAANRWRGSTKSPRPRPLPLLRSYLDITEADCFGVVAANGRSVELRPGVLFPIEDIRGAADIVPGSVVRLRRDGEDGVCATTAIPSDATFLGDRPRPVVAFPKDDLRNRDALAMTDYPHHFTVAGLPGLTAGAAQPLAQGILRGAHPKVVGAVTDNRRKRNSARLVPLRAGAMAARLVLPDDDVAASPAVRRYVPVGAEQALNPEIAWAHMSFMDGTAREIAQACRERSWRYHDARTWRWRPGRDRPVSVPLPAQARADSEPVFFSSAAVGWTLRHEFADLRRFGFPASELVEDVRAGENGRRTVWAVARADSRSVWLEAAPGRVVEVRSELVRSADGNSLADLDWSLFSPGDLVYGRVEGGVNECGHIVLESWHAGVRGAFGAPLSRRMLLPVAFADETQGALHLGEGGSGFPYPADRRIIETHPTGSAVWLDRENTLTALPDSQVAAGDIVLLSPEPEGGLRVLGLPHARVLIAGPNDRNDWPGTEWLRRILTNAQQGKGMPTGLAALPITVLHAEDGREPVLTVSRRGQPGGIEPNGSVLVRPVADLGKGYVAVRSGSALYRVAMTAVLPGLPKEVAAAAAAAFVTDGGMVELHWNSELRSLSGVRADDPATGTQLGETTVRPWFPVDREDGRCLGVVCHDTQTYRLCWLPADQAAWTVDVDGGVLLAHLSRRRLDVVRTGPCVVSLVAHPMTARSHDQLTAGQRVRVTVVEPALEELSEDRPRRSLVAVEPVGVLASHKPADGPSPAVGDSLQAEVSRASHVDGLRTVSLVEPGSRLTVLDVPKWLARSLRHLYLPDVAFGTRQPVPDLVPSRFHDYQQSYEQGLSGTSTPPDVSVDPALRVLHALGRAESDRDSSPRDKATAAAAVAAWLCSPEGEALVRQRAREVDLAPLLAVCRLGGLLGRSAGSLPAGWQAYLLGRLGDRAVSSLHTEALVTQWLTRTDRHREAADPWPRLRTVELKAELAAREVSAVLDFGTSVIGRPAAGLPESDAAPVARALLATVGALPSGECLRGDSPILSPLADLGAAVRPARTEPTPAWPVPGLLRATRRSFKQLMSTRDGLPTPLTLLAAYLPLSAPMSHYADQLLHAATRWRE